MDRPFETSEAQLKKELRAHLSSALLHSVVLDHEELMKTRAGIPDISVTWNKRTTWIEGKYANPQIRTKHKIQLHTMMQLDYTSSGIYVIWHNTGHELRTYVTTPSLIFNKRFDFRTARYAAGVDHKYVEQEIRRRHCT